MTNIDIFSGFLGAGKTTLIKKLIKEAFAGQQVVLIENEFGEIGIDGGLSLIHISSALPANNGANPAMRAGSQCSRNACPSVRVV